MLGDGANGKLATGSTSDQTTPTAPSGAFASGRYPVYSDAGYHHTCAILDNAHATCWGSDAIGQLGNGAAGDILTLHTGYLAWKAMALSLAALTLACKSTNQMMAISMKESSVGVAEVLANLVTIVHLAAQMRQLLNRFSRVLLRLTPV